jgi:peptidyl-prolyl cis-trans isomerase A (cyclophilin A)
MLDMPRRPVIDSARFFNNAPCNQLLDPAMLIPKMLHTFALTTVLGVSSLLVFSAQPAAAADDPPVVELDTTLGKITIELDAKKAPISVENFLKYVDKGFYDGLVFHRVINEKSPKMIQGGGMAEVNGQLQQKQADFAPIKNESDNGLSNVRGSIAMARTSNPNSATSQFYINHQDNTGLDRVGGGYAVFGKVIGGMDVVDAIAKVETTSKVESSRRQQLGDVPVTPVVIKSAKRKSKP